MNGPGMDGAPLASTKERVSRVHQDRVDAAKRSLAAARRTRREAEITGDVTEAMLENIVAAEEALENLLLK
jgi:hypothetical protein